MTARVAHPILRLAVVGPDGTRTVGDRVFCRYQQRSIEAGHCYGCAHCDEVTAGPCPSIVCTIPVDPTDIEDDPLCERTPVGVVLRHGTVAIDPGASVGDALDLLHAEDRRSLAVVDASSRLVGVVHEVVFVQPTSEVGDVATAMSSALALHESTPVRHALRLLASAHLREATVVDDAGTPLGVFRDVDGLHFIATSRSPAPK
jgi:CBS domain-containing protein